MARAFTRLSLIITMVTIIVIIKMIIEMQKMWHLKEIVMPVVVGALGMIKKETEDQIK